MGAVVNLSSLRDKANNVADLLVPDAVVELAKHGGELSLNGADVRVRLLEEVSIEVSPGGDLEKDIRERAPHPIGNNPIGYTSRPARSVGPIIVDVSEVGLGERYIQFYEILGEKFI